MLCIHLFSIFFTFKMIIFSFPSFYRQTSLGIMGTKLRYTQIDYWGAPFTDLPALKAHYTERVALLYHNLSNCFDSKLH